MILIADGGSTKCDWSGHERKTGKKVFTFQTKGLNPSYLQKEDISNELLKHHELKIISNKVEELYFFGSGCGNPLYQGIMKDILCDYFNSPGCIKVLGDIEGAVFACTGEPGVVAILGTGSNVCYYNGTEIDTKIDSLGYTLMDQGSGNHIGRELLKAYYFKQLPVDTCEMIESEFNLDVDLVKQNLYAKGGPSSYLASFAKFVIQNDHREEMKKIIEGCLTEFFDLSVSQFNKELKEVPLHFVGSVAYFAQSHLNRICIQREIRIGNVVKRPIERMFQNIDAIRQF